MFQEILDFLLPYIGDMLIGLFAFFGVRVTLSPKKTKEKIALKEQKKICKVQRRAAKLSTKLSSCVEFLQSHAIEKESDLSGNSPNE